MRFGLETVEEPPTKQQGELLAAISNAIVAVYADHFGRGPTKARTYQSDGVITCLLEDTMTKAERRLVERGRGSAVLAVRSNMHEVMRDELAGAVEKLTGKRVLAAIGGTRLEPDVSSEVLLLADDPASAQPSGFAAEPRS